jgi:hypothetical protein
MRRPRHSLHRVRGGLHEVVLGDLWLDPLSLGLHRGPHGWSPSTPPTHHRSLVPLEPLKESAAHPLVPWKPKGERLKSEAREAVMLDEGLHAKKVRGASQLPLVHDESLSPGWATVNSLIL